MRLRQTIYSEALKHGSVKNIHGRPLFFDIQDRENVIFQNCITSTESDTLFSALIKVFDFLDGKKSRIMFPFHDSIVFSIHKNEICLIDEISKIMSEIFVDSRFFAKFPVKVKIGVNLGQLKEFTKEMNSVYSS